LALACFFAYDIRLYAVREYGRIIHEFDPWFNFRATQYLADNGWAKFSRWFDYMSWYPLGRPVGTTIYPGMQVTAVAIWRTLGALGESFRMSLNDVCVFFPAWFGAVATLLTGLLTAECSGDKNAAVVASLVMSIVPAHTMRSVAGGYDNESLAVTAMVLTFFAWCRALRDRKSWPIGALAGLAYVYMVAAWGGYTFVLNMVGLHAAVLVLVGKFDGATHKAYSLFWIVGTLGAIQFPVVGLAPIKSMEQLGPALVFLGYQVLEITERVAKTKGLVGHAKWRFRIRCYTMAAACVLAIAAALAPTGYFGPLSVRVRGLFIKHTKTGNPLVDSVAEHQPGSADAYVRYLNFPFYVAPVGFAIACAHFLRTKSAAALFLPLYAVVAYYFANRMVRLIIFLGPYRVVPVRRRRRAPLGAGGREPRLVRGGGTRRRGAGKDAVFEAGKQGRQGRQGRQGQGLFFRFRDRGFGGRVRAQDRRACAPTVERQALARRARRRGAGVAVFGVIAGRVVLELLARHRAGHVPALGDV
jgi:dolichyl-diphosphooligosaccharide--protein glycosyltransferase